MDRVDLLNSSVASKMDLAASEARLVAREQVFALLSHEIRTPLNGVLGMAGLLAATSLDSTQTAYLSTLRESGEHLLNLVNDVLDLAKLEGGHVELEQVDTHVERLLQGVCELLSPRAHAAGLEIAWASEQPLPTIRTDDGRLRQILFNLAGNAVKLTREGGVLILARHVGGTAGRARLRFSVKDTGPGVPAAAQARIFEEFVQTPAGVRAGGAGLGLAIVKRLAGAFRGEVGVESSPGDGALFWFEAEFEVAEPAPASQELAGLTIGVVSASSILRQAAIHQVEACGGRAIAAETRAALNDSACTAVLLDPGETQADAVEPPRGAPAIVLLQPEARDRIEAFRTRGFAGYLIKPLRRVSLAARVLAARDGAAADPSDRPLAGEDERATADVANGLRVLLAEDNAVNALLARALLVREGCLVDRVSTGQEALAALADAPYDLVLMDMRMPDMDGLSAARALRSRGDTTPVIALTANAFEDDRRACLVAGMDDFLTKPLNVEALRGALSRWTRRSVGTRG